MVPTRSNDPADQKVIDDVRRHGWHVVAVTDDPHGPPFAYSIGMFHTFGHPEIILIGLNSSTTMCQIINAVGEEVRKGAVFCDWQETDQVLEGYSCVFRTVPPGHYPEYLGYAMWFYRPEPFPVLQLVWPDRDRHYPWDRAFNAETRECQPILANRAAWPFSADKDLAVFTTQFVLDGTQPIRLVSHDEEGDWQFLCGTTNDSSDGRIVSLGEIVDLSPAVSVVADLPTGWRAFRESPSDPWQRSPIS